MKGVSNSMSDFLSKFKLDSHHKIERFGVTFLILMVCMTAVLCSIVYKVHKDDSHQLTEKAIYTKNFTTSKTGIGGKVENIYTNKAHTKVFLLLKFDDVASVSTNANDYKMFLTGSSLDMTPIHLSVNPTGAFYVFGSSGYMGVYLSDVRRFDNQILDLVVRSNKEIVQNANSDSSEENQDGSFAKYDQFEIYFNAGGSDADIAEFLETSDVIEISDIYEEIITRPNEMELRTILASDLETLRTDMDRIQEYARRVRDDGIALNVPPDLVAGDTIVDADGNIIASLNPDDVVTPVKEDTVLYLKTDTVCSKGVDFNWQDSFIKDGYLTHMVQDGFTPAQYLSSIYADTKSDVFNVSYTWYRTDGTEFNYNSNGALQSDTQINTDIQNLTTAWYTYYNDKKNYQCNDLISLLVMEMEVINSDTNFTLNDSENVLTNWQSK